MNKEAIKFFTAELLMDLGIGIATVVIAMLFALIYFNHVVS